MLLVQVSDLHLDGSPERHERAARVMAYVNGLTGVDAVLVSGDIADHGEPAEYAEAGELLTSPHRVLTCPGNHDVRGPYESVLLGRPPSGGAVNEAPRRGRRAGRDVRLVPAGRADGLLDEQTLAWLDGVLADRPALVCFHHPPATMHQPMIDEILLTDPDRLAAVLDRHPGVVAVLCGHAHTAAATTFAGRPCHVAPGVVSTLRLPAERRDDLDYDAAAGGRAARPRRHPADDPLPRRPLTREAAHARRRGGCHSRAAPSRPQDMSVRGQRIVLGVLLLISLVIGLWALLAPRSFYDSFPGGNRPALGLRRRAVQPAPGQRRGIDVPGAGGAHRRRARPAGLARLAGAVWLVFSVPHWLYHSTHLGLYGTRDQALNEVGLVAVVLLAALLCVPRDRWVGGRAPAAETAEVRR